MEESKKFLLALAMGALLYGAIAFAKEPAGELSSDACGGEQCAAVARGLLAFVDRQPSGLQGNGRACADCHVPAASFQLTPAIVEARFQTLQWLRRFFPKSDDPLFRAIDADDFRARGAGAHDFRNLRENALVRVTLPLPPNVRLIDPVTNLLSSETEVDVWRSVPGVLNVKLTGSNDGGTIGPRPPNASGGYQLDARIADLQSQARGALLNHAQVAHEPSAGILDDLAAFQNVLFSSPRVRALADAVRAGAEIPDGDPPLDERQQRGKRVFTRSCATCHGGPGLSTPQPPVIRFSDIGTTCPRQVDAVSPARWSFKPCPERLARNARTYEITLSNGSVVRRTSSDPGRALLTGFASTTPATDDWNKLDVPGLHGIARSAPYFHNNSVDTLEDLLAHYREFFKRVQALNPPGTAWPPILSTDGVTIDRPFQADEEAALLAYLRTL